MSSKDTFAEPRLTYANQFFPMISKAERDFIIQGCSLKKRLDGRDLLEHRQLFMETGFISQSYSCRVTCDSDVFVSVKVTVDQTDTPRVDCKGPMAQIVEQTLNGPHGGLDFEKLRIMPGVCWVITIDILCLNEQGNLIDVVFMAIRGALRSTKLSKIKVEEIDGNFDFDVLDQEEDLEMEQVPVSVTLCKIGTNLVADTTTMEELCASSQVTFMVNKNGYLCGMQKGKFGCMNPSVLVEMIKVKIIYADICGYWQGQAQKNG